MFYSVLIPQNLPTTYQYYFASELQIGQLVLVNFNNKPTIGVVFKIDKEQLYKTLKEISSFINYTLSEKQLQLLKYISKYYCQNPGNILKMFINKNIVEEKTKLNFKIFPSSYDIEKNNTLQLSEAQNLIFQKTNISHFKTFLIEGVTGSGKTAIYIKLVIEKILKGYQCLLLIPEIALTDQIAQRFKNYGVEPFIYTSFVTEAKKREIWKATHNNDIKLIIGTRSALFLPFKNLGIIIIDEEHDNSYKQEDGTLYNARDMAILYSRINNIPIVLGSATPSIETFYNAFIGKYEHLKINSRYGGNLPSLQIINKEQNVLFSDTAIQKIERTLFKKEQVLIYFNKRGYNLISKCQNCSKILECQFCSSYLVKHPLKGVYECHYCFYKIAINNICPYCNSLSSIESFVDGIEKVAEIVSEKFPHANIGIASSDTFSTLGKINTFMENIRTKKFNIIIGTQIIAKGHHFKDITLVCILDLDSIIKSPDIRALEKAYQFVNQISGRAGREEKPGEVLLQSSLQNFNTNLILNRDIFWKSELETRKQFNLPPFKRLTAIIISNKDSKTAEKIALKITSELAIESNIQIMGPIPAPIYKLSQKYRWRILLKYEKSFPIQQLLSNNKTLQNKSVKIDIDPISFF